MAETNRVTIAAGAGFTDIPAIIPCHYLRVYADGDRNASAIEFKTPDDSFATTFTTDATSGDIIERKGPGRNGLLGGPAAFSASSQIATVLLKCRFADGVSRDVVVFQSEDAL